MLRARLTPPAGLTVDVPVVWLPTRSTDKSLKVLAGVSGRGRIVAA